MQDIVLAKPYRFVPPYRGLLWARFLSWLVPRTVRKKWGVESLTFHGAEHVLASREAGRSIIVAPNHCRPCDPLIVGLSCLRLGMPCYIMASWHLFMEGRVQRFLMRRAGTFSVYREGVDRESIRTAIDILASNERPLTLFAEGIVRRANDRLGDLMEGTSFIARSAAKQRAKNGAGGVVIHPVALRYTFDGDLRAEIEPVLTALEQRLSWRPQTRRPVVERVQRLGEGLFAIREVEYMGRAAAGPVTDRLPRLIDAVLKPLEERYLGGKCDPVTIERVKKLRSVILPPLIPGDLQAEETRLRWRHLADCYFAQQLSCYPVGYLDGEPTVERILETVERFEEDLTDDVKVYRPLQCRIEFGPAIPVEPDRPRGSDPLMEQLRRQIESMLAANAAGCHPWKESS